MALVEGIGGEFLPVFPYLVEHLLLVSVLLSAFIEEFLQLVHLLYLLLTHGLAQRVALAAGEVGQLSAQEHHLLLIHGDAVGILEILLHAGNVVLYLRGILLSGDEFGYIVHRSRPVEGVHSDEVLEDGGFELAEILLHAGRLKLEGADGASLLVEFVGEGVVDGQFLHIDGLAGGDAYVLDRLFQDGEGLESEEVHLDESGFLNHVSVVLRAEQLVSRVGLVLGGGHRHPVADIVAADDGAAGVDACIAHGALEHLGILDGVAQLRVVRHLGLPQFGHRLDGVLQVHLQSLGQSVGNGLAEPVGYLEGQTLHPRHILDGVFGGHGAVGDDMRHLLVSVLVFHPLENFSAAVVIEVGIDIRQRDTVGVKETLKQQVILDGVYLRDAQAVGHHGAGGRATARSHHHVELVAGRIDEVLHNEEVAGESHGLHDVELELHTLVHLLGNGVAIEALGALIGQFGQVVGLELDAVHLVDAAQFLYFLLSLLARHDFVAVLVAGEFLE